MTANAAAVANSAMRFGMILSHLQVRSRDAARPFKLNA
jgi:hypothetical protein